MYRTILVILSIATTVVRAADLTGKITNADGAAVANATVLLYRASPKNSSMQPQFDFPDCSKSTLTDNNGLFSLSSVDPSLQFEVLIVADGNKPLLLRHVDSALGDIQTQVEARPKDPEANQVVKGRVLDGNNKPIAGVQIDAITARNGNQFYGSGATDGPTFTDAKGNFSFVCKYPGLQVTIQLLGRDFAPMTGACSAGNDEVEDYVMAAGAAVTGRVVKDGKPVPGITIKLAEAESDYQKRIGDLSAVTKDDGSFSFMHVPPDTNYRLFGTMKSLKDIGSMPIQTCATTGEGTRLQIGNIAIEKGLTVSGQLIAAEKKIPAGAKIFLSAISVNDDIEVRTDAEGKFQLAGVPSAAYRLNVEARGFHISEQNGSYDKMEQGLRGMIQEDDADLKIQLDPGPSPERTITYYDVTHEQSLDGSKLSGVVPP